MHDDPYMNLLAWLSCLRVSITQCTLLVSVTVTCCRHPCWTLMVTGITLEYLVLNSDIAGHYHLLNSKRSLAMVYQLQQWCCHYQGGKNRTLLIFKHLSNTDLVYRLETD